MTHATVFTDEKLRVRRPPVPTLVRRYVAVRIYRMDGRRDAP